MIFKRYILAHGEYKILYNVYDWKDYPRRSEVSLDAHPIYFAQCAKQEDAENLVSMLNKVEDDEYVNHKNNWIFTFGHNRDSYVKIYGTYESARKAMFLAYGDKWCAQYYNVEDADVSDLKCIELIETQPGVYVHR